SEEHTSELQSHLNLVCRLLLELKLSFMHTNILKFHTHFSYSHLAHTTYTHTLYPYTHILLMHIHISHTRCKELASPTHTHTHTHTHTLYRYTHTPRIEH